MRRLVALAALLGLVACGDGINLDTLEQGLAFAKQRGVAVESTTDVPASGGAITKAVNCKITGKNGSLTVYQFVSSNTASTYVNANKTTNPTITFIQHGKVVFAVEGKTLGERKELLVLLE